MGLVCKKVYAHIGNLEKRIRKREFNPSELKKQQKHLVFLKAELKRYETIIAEYNDWLGIAVNLEKTLNHRW